MNKKSQDFISSVHTAKRRLAAVTEMVSLAAPSDVEMRLHLLANFSIVLSEMDEKKQGLKLLRFPSIDECRTDSVYVEEIKRIYESREVLEYRFSDKDFEGIEDIVSPNTDAFLHTLFGEHYAPRLKSVDIEPIFL